MSMVVDPEEVKVPTWINGVEADEYVGVGARFGLTLESKEKHANHTRVVMVDPPDCCTKPKNKLAHEITLVHRGNCNFTTKENIAEAANASAILIINNRPKLFKMVCEEDEPDIMIGIPGVMLPNKIGKILENDLKNNSIVFVQLYSPLSPLVHIAEVFLWLMATVDVFAIVALSGIVSRLLSTGTVFVATSNRAPTDLNQDGMQKEIFQKFVSKLNEHCENVLIRSEIDYRRVIAQNQRSMD